MAEAKEKYIGQFYCYEMKTFYKWSELMDFYGKFNSYCSRMWLDYSDEHLTDPNRLSLPEYKSRYHDWLAKRYRDGVGFA